MLYRITGLDKPFELQEFEALRISNQVMTVVGLSAPRTGRLYLKDNP